MTIGLGLDGGGTGARWCLADDGGAVLARGEAGPLSGHLFDDAQRARAEAVLESIAREIAPCGQPAGIVAGLTGLGPGSAAATHLADALARLFAVPPLRVRVENDMWIAYRAAFAPGAGILVYGGTGSIGFHLTAAGHAVRVGGHGMLIDDGGSGFWIAIAALRAILRAEDAQARTGWATPLGVALAREIGGHDWNTVRAYVYGGDRGRIGALARVVLEADDAVARGIARDAGRELARLALVLTARVGALPVALTGGLARAADIRESFRAALPGREVRIPVIDAARSAAILAAKGEA